MLATMIAPLLDRDADELEEALRAGVVVAAGDLPRSEASQLADVLTGFGASAAVFEVGPSGPPSASQSEPPSLRSTQPFDARAFRGVLEASGVQVADLRAVGVRVPTKGVPLQPPPRPPSGLPPLPQPSHLRESMPTPPVPSVPAVAMPAPASAPAAPALPPQLLIEPLAGGRLPPLPDRSPTQPMGPMFPSEPPSSPSAISTSSDEITQVVPVDDDLIRAALEAAEAVAVLGADPTPPEESPGAARPDPASVPAAPVGRSPTPAAGIRRPSPGRTAPSGRSPTPAAGVHRPSGPISAAPADRPSSAPPAAGLRRRSGSMPVAPRASEAPTQPEPPEAAGAGADGSRITGRVSLPMSMLQSKDDVPPWFPKMAMRPEVQPSRPPYLPIIAFIAVAIAGVVAYILLR